jgi:hypothetical protein
VISSALDVESKEIESERGVVTLEQMISHLEFSKKKRNLSFIYFFLNLFNINFTSAENEV